MEHSLKKNTYLTFVGLLTSKLGTYIYNFAISLYVLRVTQSSILFSVTLVVNMLPQVIISPIAGIFADRVNKKSIIVMTDILSGLSMFCLIVYAHYFELSIVAIYIASFFLSSFNAIFSTTFAAAIPEIVDKNHLVRLNALRGMAESGARIAGPILGGMIYAYTNIQLFILVNAISFIISGLSETFITFQVGDEDYREETHDRETMFSSFKAGLSYIKNDRFMYKLMLNIMFINIFGAIFSVAFPYAIINELSFTDQLVGFSNGSIAVGMLIMSMVMAKRSHFLNPLKVAALGIAIIGACCLGIGLITSVEVSNLTWVFYGIVLCGLLMGIGQIITNLPLDYLFQTRIPKAFLGRMSGLIGAMSIAVFPITAILTGVIIEAVGTGILLSSSGILIFAMSLKLLLDKSLKTDTIVSEA